MKRLARLCWTLAFLATPVGAAELTAGDLTIDQPWARASIGAAKSAAAYFSVVNHGAARDRLIAVASPVAKHVGLHETLAEGGVMKMRPTEAIEIPPEGTIGLEPGGLHVMLMGLETPLAEGDSFPLTLTFERAGSIEVSVAVLSATARHGPRQDADGTDHAMAHGDHSMAHEDHAMAHGDHSMAQGGHDHGAMVDLPAGSPAPGIELEVSDDSLSGWNVHVVTEGFRFAPEAVGQAHRDGEGHVHLYVDGHKIARLYGPWYHLAALDPGSHVIVASLNSNDHRLYAVGGRAVVATALITAGGEPADPVRLVPLAIAKRRLAGPEVVRVTEEDEVRLSWMGDEATTVHLHGYDIETAIEPGTPALTAFTASAQGRFSISAHGFGDGGHGSGHTQGGGHSEITLLHLEVHPR